MSPSISIQPLEPADFHPIATLEAHAFNDDPITIYVFGPSRASPAALQVRAHSLATLAAQDSAVRMRKAVTAEGQIVGFALWKFCKDLTPTASATGQDGLGSLEQAGGGGMGSGGVVAGSKDVKWPDGANAQLCEAVFGMSDELCRLAMRGRKYAVLSILVVLPEYQGRGVGNLLIREGLVVVDGMGLPAWLGATEVALPLYKKVGFEVDREFEFDMGLYGGSGLTKHILMIRPSVGSRNS